jgi:hypothetical protein
MGTYMYNEGRSHILDKIWSARSKHSPNPLQFVLRRWLVQIFQIMLLVEASGLKLLDTVAMRYKFQRHMWKCVKKTKKVWWFTLIQGLKIFSPYRLFFSKERTRWWGTKFNFAKKIFHDTVFYWSGGKSYSEVGNSAGASSKRERQWKTVRAKNSQWLSVRERLRLGW